MKVRKRQMDESDVAQITLMNHGDILFLYTDGVYDGSDEEDRIAIQKVIDQHKNLPAKDICNAVLAYADGTGLAPARGGRSRSHRRQDGVP